MKFKPTEAQTDAIEKDGNILVSAAAGSGKTAVLVERIARLLTDSEKPISADKILIVTFTKAAAAELRFRIEKKLGECLKADPNNSYLEEQMIKLGNANICTIDKFCLSFIRDNFERTNITPTFTMASASDLRMIEATAMSMLLDEQFDCGNEDCKALIEFLSDNGDDTVLQSHILDIYNYSRQMPYPDKWLERTVAKYQAFADGYDDEWFDKAFEISNAILEEAGLLMDKAFKALEMNPDAYAAYSGSFNYLVKVIDDLKDHCDNNDWNAISNLLQNIKYTGKKPSLSKEKQDDNFVVAKEYKDKAKDLLNKKDNSSLIYLFYADKSTIREEAKRIIPHLKKLSELVNLFADKVTKELLDNGLMTFSLAEQMALSLITEYKDGEIVPAADAMEFISDYDVVMVDEYQDTNDLQDTLFNVLSNDQKNLFCVGDAKQSIYRFRGANPHNFIEKKKIYKKAAEKGGKGLRIDLSGNFRSRKEICEFSNRLFSFIMHEDVADIEYDNDERLQPKAEYEDNSYTKVENHFIDLEALKAKGLLEDTNGIKPKIYAEANVVASIIKDIMSSGQKILKKVDGFDEDQEVDINFEDITILMGYPSKVAPAFAEILRKHKIPVAVPGDVFSSDEVQTLISLLKIIDNPNDEIALLTVMTSCIYKFTIDEIANYKALSPKYGLISGITLAAQDGNKKTDSFLNEISDFRDKNITYKVYELIDYIFDKTNLPGIVSRMDGGAMKKSNLSSARELAVSFETDGKKSLKEFLIVLDQTQDKDIKAELPYCGNAVRIGSIHSSKGLQFPICIVADNDHEFRNDDYSENLLTDEHYGLSFKYYDSDSYETKSHLVRKVMSSYSKGQVLAEQSRLLYVALTRAKEKLIVTSCFKDLKNEIDKLRDMSYVDHGRMRAFKFKKSKKFSDWLLADEFCANSDMFTDYLLKGVDCEYIHTNFSDENYSGASVSDRSEKCFNTEKLKENYAKKYKYSELLEIEAKSSVTNLVHKSDESKYQFTSKPDFMYDDGISATSRGTSTHKFMEFCDYEKAAASVEDECDRMYESGYLSYDEAEAVNKDSIRKFFESDIYRRIKEAASVKKEMSFLVELDANLVHKELGNKFPNEKVLVQGAVDLLFVEGDEIVIVDFKTDRNKDEAELIAAYAEQLNYYGIAAEQLMNKTVRQKIIYSFELGKEIII